jgi:V8-like Glu-specific endopeptidase
MIKKFAATLILSSYLFSSQTFATSPFEQEDNKSTAQRAATYEGKAEVIDANIVIESDVLEQEAESLVTTLAALDVNTIDKEYDRGKNLYYREFENPEAAIIYNKRSQPEKRIGATDRRTILGERVHETDWNCHVYLELIYYNVRSKCKTYYGSGTLIKPNILLTAGHNLYDEEDGGYPDRVDCFAACHDRSVLAEMTVFPKKDPTSVFVPQAYTKSKGEDYSSDIALIFFKDGDAANILKNNLTLANPLNFSSILSSFNNIEFYVTGYPGQRLAYTMGGKIIEEPKNNMVKYDIDTEKGQSGSGIWFKTQGKVYCIGVHAYAGKEDEDYNLGVLFHPEVREAFIKYTRKQN